MDGHPVSHWAGHSQVLNELTEVMNFSIAGIKDFNSSINS
jgi:hypothetical protein